MNCDLQAPTSAKQGKHRKTHDEIHKILLPRNATYKDGHKSDETGTPSKMHPRISTRAHLPIIQKKTGPREPHLGSVDPLGH